MEHLFSNWNALDYVFAAVILLSIIIGFVKGFVNSIISLVAWFVAFFAAMKFAPVVGNMFQAMITSEKPRYILAFIIVFIIVMILGKIIQKVLSGLITISLLGFFDKILGLLFGVVRGILFAVIIIIALQIAYAGSAAWIQGSQLAPHFHGLIAYFQSFIPKDLFITPQTVMDKISSFAQSIKSHLHQ